MTEPSKECPMELEHALLMLKQINEAAESAARAINAYEAARPAQSPVVDEWQPIEAAPKDGTHIFLFEDHSFEATEGVFIGCFAQGAGWDEPGWMEHDSGVEYRPTMWKPMNIKPPVTGEPLSYPEGKCNGLSSPTTDRADWERVRGTLQRAIY